MIDQLVCSVTPIRNPILGFLLAEIRLIESLPDCERTSGTGNSHSFYFLYRSMSREIVSKSEEVAFPSKANWVDRTNKIRVDELIRVLCSFLRIAIVDLGCFCPLAAVTYSFIQFDNEINAESLKILSKYSEVKATELSVPGWKILFVCHRACVINWNVWPW